MNDKNVENQLIAGLIAKNMKISCAESFTGGEIIRRLISVSGASKAIVEGIVAYSEYAKQKRLGVKGETLEKFKPVSKEVALEMLNGIDGDCDLALSTTGLAGPNSDDSGFPVGLCYIGVSVNGKRAVYEYNFKGTREEIIRQGAETALSLALKNI